MEMIRATTSDAAWQQAFGLVVAASRDKHCHASRAGDTYEVLHVAIEVEDPRQHWVVSRLPAINPAFGIAEVVWILAGSNDAEVLNFWFPQLPNYAGHGPLYSGAYGYRLRHHFGVDQLERACEILSANPNSRQAVLQYWDGRGDLPLEDGLPRSADIPCNIMSLLKVRDKCLHWTQVMRSNDVCRGLPYNLLQFTVMQEILAGWLGLNLGYYCHWSDSLHAYAEGFHDFSICEPTKQLKNIDDLRTDARTGQRIIDEMYRRLVALTRPGLSTNDISQLALASDLPTSYQNLLVVLCAESARRRGYLDQAKTMMISCNNETLRLSWSSWVARLASSLVPAT